MLRTLIRALNITIVCVAGTLMMEGVQALAQNPIERPIQKGAHYESFTVGRPRVIIFVHGFTGDSVGTWLSSNGAYFPALIATDPTVKLADVFVASYETHWTNDTGIIESLAVDLFHSWTISGWPQIMKIWFSSVMVVEDSLSNAC